MDDETPAHSVDRPPPFSMLRSYTLADLFTLSNAACGTSTIFCCLNYLDVDGREPFWLWLGFALLPVALVADALDGWVARRGRRKSAIGADLDSLADIVSFGVAPAVLGFTLGLRGGWDILILIYFVVCGISRLARFNVTADVLADPSTGKVKYFEGTPIPTSVLIVILLCALFALGMINEDFLFGELRPGWRFHPFSLIYLVSGSLMISTIRVPKP